MAADPPLSHLVLAAASVADDLGFVALADLRTALGEETGDYRIIGGHMVTTLAARWQLGAGLYRETGDADLGISPVVVRDRDVVGRPAHMSGLGRSVSLMIHRCHRAQGGRGSNSVGRPEASCSGLPRQAKTLWGSNTRSWR
jgi:hypothetical protein